MNVLINSRGIRLLSVFGKLYGRVIKRDWDDKGTSYVFFAGYTRSVSKYSLLRVVNTLFLL